MNAGRLLGYGAAALVALGLILGFADFGTPEHNRLLRDDRARLDALQGVATRIALTSCKRCGSGDVPARLTEPEANDPKSPEHELAYTRDAFGRYRICTTFALASDGDDDALAYERGWHHPAGKFCYHFNADSATPLTEAPSAVLRLRVFRAPNAGHTPYLQGTPRGR
jgi:hypothetical protein